MRHLTLLIFLLLNVCRSIAGDAPYAIWWQKANGYYQQQQYDSAAYYYQQIADLQPTEALVYYNLGNAYYRMNDIGHAVLNYEKALHLDPGYKDASDNLSLTQGRIANRISEAEDIFFIRWWNELTLPTYANAWAMLCLLLFLVWIGVLIAGTMGKFRKLPVKLNIATIACLLLLLIVAYMAALNKRDSGKAVVMQNNAALMTAPAQGRSQSLIPEGTTVQLERTQQDWVEVQLPDGRRGWLQKAQLAII